MEPYLIERFYNPSATYLVAQAVRSDVTQARENIARIIGCRASEIIFTAGGTEANNLAVEGVLNSYGGTALVSAIEHPSVIEAAKAFDMSTLPVTSSGRIDVGKLQECINDETVLVSIGYVNNEIGTIQPIAEVSKLIQGERQRRVGTGNTRPIYLHTDACQAGNYLPLLVHSLGVDLMTVNGGKLYGPKQSGMLYVKAGIELTPIIYGGGQERGVRSGTENVAAIIGLSTALQEAQEQKDAEQARLQGLQTFFMSELKKQRPNIIINGDVKHRIANNVHITIPDSDNERLMMELDEQGCIVAVGSACSASSDEPSHVLKAIGLSDQAARGSLRLTFGRSTDQSAIEQLLRHLFDSTR